MGESTLLVISNDNVLIFLDCKTRLGDHTPPFVCKPTMISMHQNDFKRCSPPERLPYKQPSGFFVRKILFIHRINNPVNDIVNIHKASPKSHSRNYPSVHVTRGRGEKNNTPTRKTNIITEKWS